MSPEAAAAPRKRATTRKKTAPRRTASTRVKRKAPTPKKTESSGRSYIKLYIALLVAFIVVTSISVYIGTRDKGIIDVNATISARAALEEAKGNTALSETIRSVGKNQSANREIADALVGAGNKVTEQQKNAKKNQKTPVATASSSASSTTATSTDAVEGDTDAEEIDDSEDESETKQESAGDSEEDADSGSEEIAEEAADSDGSESNESSDTGGGGRGL